MGRYYMLESYTGWDPIQDIHQDAKLEGVDTWLLGRPFTTKIKEPIAMQWDEGAGGSRKKFYKAVEPPLFHRDLYEAFVEAGVDNLVAYKVRITDPATGEVCDDYLGINIIGL
ncbi:MAG: hypothetical protein ABIK28_18075, partial [Planctomycetota bacterium]